MAASRPQVYRDVEVHAVGQPEERAELAGKLIIHLAELLFVGVLCYSGQPAERALCVLQHLPATAGCAQDDSDDFPRWEARSNKYRGP